MVGNEGEVGGMEELRNWVEALGPMLLGVAGLWAAHSYQRTRRLKLAEDRVGPYGKLWHAMAASNAARRSKRPLTPAEAQTQLAALRAWYHGDHGGAMLLPIPTLKMLLLIIKDLGDLAAIGDPPPGRCGQAPADEARRRGVQCLAEISLLRTQLKIDLDVYDVDERGQLQRLEKSEGNVGRRFLERACVNVDDWGRAPRWWRDRPFHWEHYDGQGMATVTLLGEECREYTERNKPQQRRTADQSVDKALGSPA